MYQDKKLWIGTAGEERVYLYPKMANRHGLIAGATGSGKTVSLKVLAESFSDAGVPVFLADVKGDLAGMCLPGEDSPEISERMKKAGISAEDGFRFREYPVTFWDVYGERGIPLRTTISEVGPLLLSRILGLNETQSDILSIVFRIADEEGLLLLDSRDLRAMLQFVGEHAKEYSLQYGNIARQSLAAVVRSLTALEGEGAELFFGEPALNLMDWFSTDCDGRGMIHVLECQKLILNPNMYAAFMLWMLSELYETLPERGDGDKPRMVFFLDEAHLLFDSVSPDLLSRVEQVVKLIRSKGVGIYFVTQNPSDIPDGVLAQLGNKIQHSLHAYTPAERKAVKAAAQSFRENPEFDTMEAIQALGVGEALISVLDEEGVPTVAQRCRILPPQSKMGPAEDSIRDSRVKDSLFYLRYAQMLDRESAYECLVKKAAEAEKEKQELEAEKQREKEELAAKKQREKEELAAKKQREKEELAARKQREKEELAAQKKREREELAAQKKREKEALEAEKQRQKEQQAMEREMKAAVGKAANSAVGTIGREVGNSIGKQLGGSFGKKVGGNVGASLGRGLLQTFLKIR